MLCWQQAPHHQALLGKSCSRDEEGWGEARSASVPGQGCGLGRGSRLLGFLSPQPAREEQPLIPIRGGKLGVKAQPRGSVRALQAQEAPETRREAGSKTSRLRGRATHSQVQHVHRHRLLRQHLHRGVRVHRDGAAAHCQAQRCQGGAARGVSTRGSSGKEPPGSPKLPLPE